MSDLQRVKAKVYIYEREKSLEAYIASLNHNPAFRKGFWIFSLERFFALNSWHLENPSATFLHIESDILIMKNFPWNSFNGIDKLTWCRFNQHEDVASFVYSPNVQATVLLVEKLKEQISVNNKSTDMSALGAISNQNDVNILPRLGFDEERVGTLNLANSNHTHQFHGVFDEATIGMWLIGQDPRNNFGISKKFRVLTHADVDPSKYIFRYSSKNVLTASRNGKEVSVYNLHVHSKKLLLFSKYGDLALKVDVLMSKYKFPSFTISPKAFIATTNEYFSRNRILSRETYIKIYHIFFHK